MVEVELVVLELMELVKYLLEFQTVDPVELV